MYNFMFYMIGRRLINCHCLHVLCGHVCFFSPMLSYFPVFFVVTDRCVDKGMIGNYQIISQFPISLVQYNARHDVILIL